MYLLLYINPDYGGASADQGKAFGSVCITDVGYAIAIRLGTGSSKSRYYLGMVAIPEVPYTDGCCTYIHTLESDI